MTEYVGGYDDWLRQRAIAAAAPAKKADPAPAPASAKQPARKFLNREKRELEEMPQAIATLEAEQAALTEKLADPVLYQKDPAALPRLQADLEALEAKTLQAYARWEELEALRAEAESA
ncbi:MAG: hypothetical protein PW734_06040 [Verrucomicrobium sp.]|nr:hypothetical protein [Verrucomicrobium sp.]